MGYICEKGDNCEEYLPKIIVRHKQKNPLQHIATTDTYTIGPTSC
jgi:hypothetical protein